MRDILYWQDAARVLTDLNGTTAQIWQFSASLVRMAIRLYRPHQTEDLFLVAVGCARISGPFRWENARLEIIEAEDPEHPRESIKLVRDRLAGFELQCSDVILTRSTMAELDLASAAAEGNDLSPPSAIDPHLVELFRRASGVDDAASQSALVEVMEMLEGQIPPAARSFVRSSLIECIDRDRTGPNAVTAICVLGKLYDPSLEPYLATLAAGFVDDEHLGHHLHQTVIALDNLEALPQLSQVEAPLEAPTMRRIVLGYLRERGIR